MPEFLLQCQGTIHTLSTPWIMGILNSTPDSFFAGSRLNAPEEAAERARTMLNSGARIIDIGGYSSRPGADPVTPEQEWNRLKDIIPAVSEVLKDFPDCFISVDTFRAEIADKALHSGAHWINDISGGNLDPEIYHVAAAHRCPYIIMHMQGNPSTMQLNPTYTHVTQDIIGFFSEKLPVLHDMGIHDTIVDVGFGFGKTLEHLGRPILTGVSRKSMIYKALEVSAEESLNGTTALHMAALLGGTQILRVHDVAEAAETINLFNRLMPDGVQHLLEPWER
jgi:dihydropteroate synthase